VIPYSTEVFFAILSEYNRSVWPAQLLPLALGLAAIVFAVRAPARADRPLAVLLATAWGWTALAYHLGEFAAIDFWAYGFSAAFAVQSVLLVWAGLVRRRISFGPLHGAAQWTGLALMVLGLWAHPAVAMLLGREISETACFGVAPGPTVVFTLGILVLARPRAPYYLIVIPLLGCVLAGAVAMELGIYQDYVLIVAGLAAAGMLIARRGPATDS
jgi:hypothetical protein